MRLALSLLGVEVALTIGRTEAEVEFDDEEYEAAVVSGSLVDSGPTDVALGFASPALWPAVYDD